MLEPRGADSSASHESATDVSARVSSEARNALLQGRIADALDLVDGARHDPGPHRGRPGRARPDRAAVAAGPRRPARRRAVLTRADLAGARPRTRRPPRACFGLGEFAAARGTGRPGGVLLRERRRGARRRGRPHLAARGAAGWPGSSPRAARSPRRPGWSRRSSPRRGSSTRRTPSPTRCARCPRSRRPSERVELLDEALGVLDGAGAARLEAQIRTDLAGWLLLLQPTESARAIDLLRSCREVRPPGGARPAAGPHPLAARASRRGTRRRAAGRLAELSAAERRVAQLVVLGKRNREIAVELGVSVKSVEWHVSHILRKLSITSRLDLADALAQPRQAPLTGPSRLGPLPSVRLSPAARRTSCRGTPRCPRSRPRGRSRSPSRRRTAPPGWRPGRC